MKSGTFTTERLPLAIYLHASQRLRFSGCEDGDAGKVQFVFLDPDGLGDQLELEFENGALVQAKSLFASQTFLRRKMTWAQAVKSENRKTEYAYHTR
jgi:hypothetical protein